MRIAQGRKLGMRQGQEVAGHEAVALPSPCDEAVLAILDERIGHGSPDIAVLAAVLDEDHPAAAPPVQGHLDAVGVVLAGRHADHARADAGLFVAERLRDGRFPQGFGEQGDGEIKGFVLRESERQGRRGRIAEQPERDGVVPPVPVEREHDGQIERLPEAEPFDAGKGQAEQDVPRDMLQEIFPSGRGGLAPDGRQFLGCPCGGPVPFQQAGKQPVVPLRIQDAAHDEVLRIREGEFRSVQHGHGKGAAAERFQNPGGTVQPVDQRFHGADKPRGQYEIPIAVVVLRAVKSVQVIPEPGGKLRDELARLPGGRFQPFGIGQRFRRHVETGFFG